MQTPETISAPEPQTSVRLLITEIYLSVQGESTWVGQPCTFVRLTGCPLRCTYCDTEYAFYGGTRMELSEVLARIAELGCPLVEVTGGEPLAQPNCIPLLQSLIDAGYAVLLETSGAYSIADVPHEVHKIVDLKGPSSGEMHRNLYENVALLAPHDEVKFVLGSREDYEWARSQVKEHSLTGHCRAVLFSCVFGKLEPAQLVEWITQDRLFDVRFQLQAHKFIWPPDAKGV
jgi:7-carboxy-7-deazaguanine synthase